MSKKKTPILSNLFFLLKFIWKINKRIYALNIFKVVLDIAQSLTTVIFLRYIVQYIIIDKNWTLTAIFVGALVVSLGITQILSSVIEPILRKDMDLLEKQILTQVGMTAIKMDYFEMEKPFAKDLLQLAQDPGKFVGVLENVIVSISTFVTIIGLAATILAVDKILIVPLLVAIVLILLSEKVKTLDNGLDTLYSKEFDKNGVELSGGESQKLAIARACYKDAPIIILDEPTASLDAVAEYEIYAGFEKLVENKTAIIISHRLSSTHFCDRIIVINNGTVFEDGTHQSLMAKESGIYKKMFTTQAAHYFSDPTTVAVVD